VLQTIELKVWRAIPLRWFHGPENDFLSSLETLLPLAVRRICDSLREQDYIGWQLGYRGSEIALDLVQAVTRLTELFCRFVEIQADSFQCCYNPRDANGTS